MSQDETPQLPEPALIERVAGTENPDWFWRSGAWSVRNLNAVLGVVEKTLADFGRILDWGCGCGRILLHLKAVGERCELHGVDIDELAVAWARQHIPWARCRPCQGLPPLDFPDAYFDLVYNHSVLTHLDESYQDAWLAELRRVVKPGGLVALSVSGEHPFSQLEANWRAAGADPAPLRKRLRTGGHVYIKDDSWTGGPFPDFYHSAFHAPWYVFEHWRQYFDIRAYVVRGALDYQDLVLMRRPE